MDRTERFYKIQDLLKQHKKLTMKQLQDSLGISRATACRDLDYLRDRLGVPIVWDPKTKTYVLESLGDSTERHELPGVWFSESEIHGLLSMIELIHQMQAGGHLAERMTPLKQRLEILLEQGTGSASEILKRIRILPMARRPVLDEHFQWLADSLVKRQRVRIRHLSRKRGEVIERDVSPQRLVYYRDNWYLDAYCHLRDDLRSFALDAMEQISLLDKPALSVPEKALAEYYEQSYGIFNGEAKNTARLKFSPFRAQWVAKEIWHPQQRGRFEPDGYYILEVPYGNDTELLMDIMQQGPEVEVLAPKILRDRVAQSIAATHNLYQASH
jgi:predicted DNA-binding transcriptional regulator YafY